MPLSFRYVGRLDMPESRICRARLDDGALIRPTWPLRHLIGSMTRLEQFNLGPQKVFAFLKATPSDHSYLATVVTTMFLLGDFDSAETLGK